MSERTVSYTDEGVKLKSNGPIGRMATLSIGGVGIPFRRVTVNIQPDELITLTVEVRAEDIDIAALQAHTSVIVEGVGGE